ncbi:hypothetical protein CPC08DRAFT_205947 [Agrocybe pediades]|nr:hypothetical protein CPC08DRAFT_205947 [Agrocybe pediades]
MLWSRPTKQITNPSSILTFPPAGEKDKAAFTLSSSVRTKCRTALFVRRSNAGTLWMVNNFPVTAEGFDNWLKNATETGKEWSFWQWYHCAVYGYSCWRRFHGVYLHVKEWLECHTFEIGKFLSRSRQTLVIKRIPNGHPISFLISESRLISAFFELSPFTYYTSGDGPQYSQQRKHDIKLLPQQRLTKDAARDHDQYIPSLHRPE